MPGTSSINPQQQRANRYTAPLFAAFLLLLLIFCASPNFRPDSGPAAGPFGGDVLQEWIGGYVVRAGDHGRFYDTAYVQQLEHDERLVGFAWRESEYFPLVYPPFYYLLVSPLSLLPFHTAAILWAGLMVAAYLAAWRLFQKSAAMTGDGQAVPHWLLPLSLLFMPLIESFTSSQKGSLLLLILTCTYYLLLSKRSYSAGVVFGLIAFKPHFALPIAIAMLCKGQWRFVLGGLTTGSLLVGLCLLLGLDVCRQYIAFSTQAGEYLQNAGYDLTKSHAWSGFFALLLGGPGSAAQVMTLLASGATILIVALALRGPLDFGSRRFAWQFAALIAATVLISPHLYTYDLTVLLLPLGLVAVDARHQPLPLRWLALLLFCLAGLSPQLAGVTGLQITVPLLFAYLVANAAAAASRLGFDEGSRIGVAIAGLQSCHSPNR